MYKYLRVTISHDNQQVVTNKLFERDKKIESFKSKNSCSIRIKVTCAFSFTLT
jgi:hypothetical protein